MVTLGLKKRKSFSMAARSFCLVSLLCFLAVVNGSSHQRGEMQPPQRETTFKTAGGKVELWSRSFQPLQDANIEAVVITLEAGGLVLPQYADSPALYFLKEGNVRVGMSYPWGDATTLKNMSKGSVVVVPAGWVFWWHNAESERAELLSMADISNSIYSGKYQSIHLAGDEAKHGPGGILHGFSKDLLALAWNVTEDIVDQFVNAQQGVAIVKVQPGFLNAEYTKADQEAAEDGYLGEFLFKLSESYPDLEVKDGGNLSIVSRDKWPALKQIGLSLLHARLEPGALFAPSWSPTSHAVGFVTKGKGRVQIANQDGGIALDINVQEGDLFVVPRFFPALKVASSDEQLEWVVVTTGSRPQFTFLAGKNSIYKAFPLDILTNSFDVSEDFERKILSRRTHDTVIFPSRKEGSEESVDEDIIPESSGKASYLEAQAMEVWFKAQETLD